MRWQVLEQQWRAEWGARIRDLRADTGMSQQEFARELGVAKSTLVTWEQGRTAPLDVQKALIADVLAYRAADLFVFSDPDPDFRPFIPYRDRPAPVTRRRRPVREEPELPEAVFDATPIIIAPVVYEDPA